LTESIHQHLLLNNNNNNSRNGNSSNYNNNNNTNIDKQVMKLVRLVSLKLASKIDKGRITKINNEEMFRFG
jgi:hypothetical protein